MKTLRIVRGYFVAYAVICAGAALLFFLAKASVVYGAVALGLAAVAVAGALLVVQQPLVWTVVNAVLATPVLAFALYTIVVGGVGLTNLLLAITGIAFWFAVPMAARLQTLMRQYPDLWAFRRTKGELVGAHAAMGRDEAKRARRRVLVGLGLVVAAIVALGWWASRRPSSWYAAEPAPLPAPTKPFEPAETAWRSAWNRSNVDEVKGFLAAGEKAQHEPFFDRQRKKRGWERLPNLGPSDVTEHGAHRRSAAYVLDDRDVPLQVYWEWEPAPERWVVVNWSFPNR